MILYAVLLEKEVIDRYIKPALRQIISAKLSSSISILGLTTAMIAVGLLAIFVRYEQGYDEFWPDADKIYRVELEKKLPGLENQSFVLTPGNLKSPFQSYFPEVIDSARLYFPTLLTGSSNGKDVQATTHFADQNIIDILQFDVIEGDIKKAMGAPNSLVVTETGMNILFGSPVKLGTTISLENGFVDQADYTVRAIVKDIPSNSMFNINILSPFNNEKFPSSYEDWDTNIAHLFVKLSENTSIEQLKKKIPQFVNRTMPVPKGSIAQNSSTIFELNLTNIRDIHLHSSGFGESGRRGDYDRVVASIGIAFIVFVIATLNYINLNTANSITRAKEISIRKIVGARRRDLFIQFQIEAFIIVFVSITFSVAAIEILTPYVGNFLALPLSSTISSNEVFYIVTVIFLIAFLCGFYPAMYLATYRPSQVLGSNGNSHSKDSSLIRNTLVAIQFIFSTGLILATGIVFSQLYFARNFDRGFETSNMLTINIPRTRTQGGATTFITEVTKLPEVTAASAIGFQLQSKNFRTTNFRVEDVVGAKTTSLVVKNISHNLMETWGTSMLAGRDLDFERDSDQLVISSDWRAGKGPPLPVIINITALRQLGFDNSKDVIGTLLFEEGGDTQLSLPRKYEIIGVYPDFHLFGMDQQVQPVLYRLWPIDFNVAVAIRFKGDPEIAATAVIDIWERIYPDHNHYLSFLEDIMRSYDEREENELLLFAIFTVMAILFACMGLFALSEFAIRKRRREMGIRRVLGATKYQLITLALWDFSKPVFLAVIIATPSSIYFMQSWLQTFVYRIDNMTLILVALGGSAFALLIAWATVGINAQRIAKISPVKALKYD